MLAGKMRAYWPHRFEKEFQLATSRIIPLALAAGLTLAAALPAAAQETKRKVGLWETKSTVMGMTNSIRQCVGPGSDDMMARGGPPNAPKPDCSVNDIKRQSNGITMHSVCKMEGRTITTDGIFTGSFDSAYKGKIVSQIDPSQNGMKSTEINIEAKWLGACEAGQKPGDMIMSSPGGGSRSINMNDPKIKEMMEKMKAAREAQK